MSRHAIDGETVRPISRVDLVRAFWAGQAWTPFSAGAATALAAGVSDKLWEVSDIVALVEAGEAKTAARRGPYKKMMA